MWHSLIVFALFVALAPASFAPDTVYQGKVTTVGSGKITILTAGGENKELQVASDAKITLNGKPAKLSDIETGDVAKITVDDQAGKPVAVTIEAHDAE